MTGVRFDAEADRAFAEDLHRESAAYLARTGDHRFADGWMVAKIAALLLAAGASYAWALTGDGAARFALGYVGFSALGMLLAVNSLHDLAHRAVFRHPLANAALNRLVSLPVGVDPDYWRVRHVFHHHPYPNIEPVDLDLQENGILRQTPFQPWYPRYRYQHLYWIVTAALSLPYVSWFFDWSDRLGRTPIAYHPVLRGPRGWALFVASKVAHVGVALVVPLGVAGAHGIGPGTVLAAYVAGQTSSSLVVVALLLGTHWADARFYRVPPDGRMPHGWYRHTMLTTCDWQIRPPSLSYWLGGLPLHLTHHLFPTWNHRHYPALAELVQEVAARHGMPYRRLDHRQLWTAQQRFLAELGRGP